MSRIAAWRCLRSEMRTASRPELWRYTADMLYLIEDRSVRENFFPAVRMDHDVTPAEAGDWDAIAALAADAPNIRGGLEVLRAWWEAVPQAFAVARDAEGRVAGFRCACEPHEVSPRVLDADPVGSEWRAHLRTSPIPKGQRAVWARYGVRRETTEGFDAALAALLLDMKRLYVAKRPELRRIYTEPLAGSTAYCAMTLGYVPVPGSPSLFNDLGPGSIDGWLAGLGARELLDEEEGLDVADRRLRLDGAPVDLTRLEAEVLGHLQSHAGRAVRREDLLREVWGHEWTGGSNVVEVVVSSLRKKLGDHAASLETVRGVGYRLRDLG